MPGIGSINFDGLASGLDTKKIIEDLIKVDSQPLNRLDRQKEDLKSKSDVYNTIKSNLLELKEKAYEVKNTSTLEVLSASSSDEEALSINVSPNAIAGNYSLKVLTLAKAKTLSGNSFEATDTDLGFSGDILINNKSFTVRTTDSLIDIRNAINALDSGATANILKIAESDYRLIVSSQQQGSDGFFIANAGGNDILGDLGLTDGTKSVRTVQNGSVLSSNFDSSGSTIGSLIGLSADASGDVQIRNSSLSIDLGSDTLSSIRDKINGLGLDGVSASVEQVEVDGDTKYRLEISGTENFTDDGNVLETLGILVSGTSGTQALVETSTLYLTGSDTVAQNNTKLNKIGADTGGIPETITISGTNTDGSEVLNTIEIEINTTVADVIQGIEDTFSGNVTAYLDNGKISVRSNIAGVTPLDVSVTANNENDGTLDFGIVRTVVAGRDRLVVEGTNAKVLVNNVEVTRDTNEIDDILTGLSLSLRKADAENDITITIDHDHGAIYDKINGFVESYNKFVEHVNENSQFDSETKVSGPLNGDLTTRTTIYRTQNILQSTIGNNDVTYNQLALVGIELTAEGILDLNTSKLNEAMNTDIDAVMELFTISRTASDNDISFVYSSKNTTPGEYSISVTTAAERAEVTSDAIESEVGSAGTILLTDNYDTDIIVDYTAQSTLSDIAGLINVEAQETYAEILQSSASLNPEQGQGAVNLNTVIDDIFGASADTGDTITINGIDRSGKEFQRIITLTSPDSHTVEDILNSIEDVTNNEVSASINANGNIVVQDKQTGPSEIGISIITTVQGLDFGTFVSVQEGRNQLSVEASVTNDDRLEISHSHYGSDKTFTISGAEALGIAGGEYAGVDVAGSINGVEGTGSGQSLSMSGIDDSAQDIVVNVSITPGELVVEGSDQGTITLISGIAERMYSEVSSLTNIVDGFIETRIDSIEIEIDSYQDRIDTMQLRIDQRREMYVRRFTRMEQALARLQSIQQRLTSSLNALPAIQSFG
ncbi:flagellar filament capping protein FliD [Candidatus Latescibacterota bacterium]